MLVFGTGLLKRPLLDAFAGRLLNIHLGLSPYYRGAGTNFWPLVNREPEFCGATIHFLDEGVDTGPIIAHVRPAIRSGDGPHDIGNRTIVAAADTLAEAAAAHAASPLIGVPQAGERPRVCTQGLLGGRGPPAVRQLHRRDDRRVPERPRGPRRPGAARVHGDARVVTDSCLAVMYHYVRDTAATPFPAIRALPPALFERQLDWLQAEYELVDARRARSRARRRPAAARRTPRSSPSTTGSSIITRRCCRCWPRAASAACSSWPTTRPATRRACSACTRRTSCWRALGSDAFGDAVLGECRAAARAARASGAAVFGLDRWEHADERAIKDLLNYELPIDEAERVLDVLFARAPRRAGRVRARALPAASR